MDFLDPKKKKAHKRRLYIGYALMAIAIGFGAMILLYAAFGYGVDKSGNVFQNGLVFLASTPDGANVSLSNESGSYTQTTTTSSRLVLPADKYTFNISKDGYRSWSRSLTLKGGQVERLVYPFLFPTNLVTKDRQLYSSEPGLAISSPDRHWIMVRSPTQFNVFDVFDANDTTAVSQPITLPTSLFAAGAKAQSLELVEWSTDNRHVLMKYTHDGATEYIMVDREAPDQSVNLNQLFGLAPKTIMLRDKNFEEFYMLMDDGTLISANSKDKSKNTILTNVVTFWPHGSDTIAYISNKDSATTQKVTADVLSGNTSYELRTLQAGDNYLVNIASYNDHWYVAVGASGDNQVYVYRDPVDTLKRNDPNAILTTRTMRIDNPQKVSFSNNAQFIAVQSGQKFVTYDALADRQYHYEISGPFDGTKPATWMDGHRLTTVSGSKIMVFDFDGSNQQTLNNIQPDTLPMFDRDYKTLYSIAPSVDVPGRFALTSTNLRVE